jgi:hypothetical protein
VDLRPAAIRDRLGAEADTLAVENLSAMRRKAAFDSREP